MVLAYLSKDYILNNKGSFAGLSAGVLTASFMFAKIIKAHKGEDDNDIIGMYILAYILWVIYFKQLLKNLPEYAKKLHIQAGLYGKLLACSLLLAKAVADAIARANKSRVDGRFVVMTASLLFLLSSLIFNPNDNMVTVLGKFGSTFLLAVSLASLQTMSDDNLKIILMEFFTVLFIGFIFLTASVINGFPKPIDMVSVKV